MTDCGDTNLYTASVQELNSTPILTEDNPNMLRLSLAIAVILLAASFACGGGREEVRMGTEGAYPPYNFVDDNGELTGFELELGDDLCRRADLDCTWVTNDWDSIIPNLLAGDYDTILAGMSITAERDELIDFTQPYVPPSPSVYLALDGAGDGVVSGTVAAQVATIQADYLAGSGATMREYDLAPDLVSAVLDGDVDAALVDEAFAIDSITGADGKLTMVGPKVDLDLGIGIGVREDDTDLKNKLDQAITEMKRDGSLNSLIRKWFAPDAHTF